MAKPIKSPHSSIRADSLAEGGEVQAGYEGNSMGGKMPLALDEYAEGGQIPEGLDDFLGQQDPQGAMAAQGLGQLGQMAGRALSSGSGTIAQASQEGVEPESSPIDLLAGGAAPKVTEAIAGGLAPETFGKIVGNEIGAIGANVTGKAAIRDAGEAAPGAIQKLIAKKGSASINQPGLTQKELNFAMQKANRPKNYAEGGMVRGSFPQSMNGYAEGGEIPQGLDEFLSSPQTQAPIANSAPEGNEPQGLNEFIAPEMQEEKYGTLGQQGKAALEGLGQGLVGPLAPMLEEKAGVEPEVIRARSEANPIIHYGSEIAGLVAPALIPGGGGILAGLAKYGTQSGALSAVGKLFPEATTLAGKIGVGAAQSAIDNMLITGSDEASKLILNDPNQSAETAMANIGLAGTLGGGLGGALGASGALWKATLGDKAGKLIEDFKGRINEHLNNPEPADAIHNELSDYYSKIKSTADEVYGPNGIKSQDIAKALPEINAPIADQAQGVYSDLKASLSKMQDQPNKYPQRLTGKLSSDLDAFQAALSKDNVNSADVFNSMQDLKQTLQGYSKYDKFVKPFDEAYDFVRDSKSMANQLKTALEDKEVWGKAAQRQEAINTAFKQYLPALKDFESKFTTEIGGEKVIDPAKVNTYVNNLDKAGSATKKTMLKNFLEASEKYKKVIGDSHSNLGLENPVENAPMNATLRTLDKKTTGEKLADAFIEKGLKSGAASGISTTIGAGAGELIGGHAGAGIGALIGHQVLTPFFNSVLPGIAKALVSGKTNAAGFKAAADYGVTVAKGENALTKASKDIFKTSSKILPEASLASDKNTAKLDKMLRDIQVNPEKLMNKSSDMGHYLPNHSQAVDQSTAQAVTYLNSLRPDLDRKAPLDSKPVASSTQKAAYNNALQIAQDPLSILDKARDGTLTQQDIAHMGNMYPSLYQRMQQKVGEALVNAKNSGNEIAYKTRIGVSMLLAQPMDSTMTPMAIQATQLPPQSGQQQQQNNTTSPKRGTKSSPALQKMSNLYKTPGQTREASKQKE